MTKGKNELEDCIWSTKIVLALDRINSNIVSLVKPDVGVRNKVQSENTFFFRNFEPNRLWFWTAAHLIDFFQSQKLSTFSIAQNQKPALNLVYENKKQINWLIW